MANPSSTSGIVPIMFSFRGKEAVFARTTFLQAGNQGNTGRIFILATWVLCSILFANRGNAADSFPPIAAKNQKPILLMLFLQSSDVSLQEEQLRSELELSIDTHQLVVEREFRFKKANLSEKIEEIRMLEVGHSCDAVIWLEKKDASTVTLQLAVMGPGQFTVQSVQADLGNGDVGELTIAARQLLNDIHIPMRFNSLKSPEVESHNDKPGNTDDASLLVISRQRRYFMSLDMGFAGAFRRSLKSPPLLSGTFGWGAYLPNRIQWSLIFSVFGRAPMWQTDFEIQTFGIRFGGQIVYLWKIGSVSIGPFAGILIPYQNARVSMNDSQERREAWWNLDFLSGVSVQFPVGRWIRIQVRPAVELFMQQKVFKRRSDESTIYATPYLAGSIAVGLVYMFL